MPKVYYYVVRQGADEERFVPMIPIDQLPDWLEVVGVPRALHADEAAKMTALLDIGRKGGAAGVFDVRVDEASTSATTLSTGTTPISPTSATSSAVSLETHTSATTHDAEVGKANDEAANTANTEPAVTTKPETSTAAQTPDSDPTSNKKSEKALPCKYWCKYGRCGFKNHCRFAHIMPSTKEGRSLVGLSKLPQWFVKYGEQGGTKRGNPTGSYSSNSITRGYNHSGSPVARKTFKIQKTTTMASSPYTFNQDGETRGPEASEVSEVREADKPATADTETPTAREAEDDLIDLV